MQQAVECGQAVGAQLDNQIPFAAGRVDCRDLRKAAQCINDAILRAPFDLDERDAANGSRDHIRLQHHRIADHLSALLEPLHASPNGRA